MSVCILLSVLHPKQLAPCIGGSLFVARYMPRGSNQHECIRCFAISFVTSVASYESLKPGRSAQYWRRSECAPKPLAQSW